MQVQTASTAMSTVIGGPCEANVTRTLIGWIPTVPSHVATVAVHDLHTPLQPADIHNMHTPPFCYSCHICPLNAYTVLNGV